MNLRKFLAVAALAAMVVTDMAPITQAVAATSKSTEATTKKAKKIRVITGQKANPARRQPVAVKKCDGLMECLFGTRRGVRVKQDPRMQQASLTSASFMSRKRSRQTVDWTNSKYPVGSLVVNTPERALYLIQGNGEALRYSVGVGREGFQWGGSSRIVNKQEWPSWTPPAEMIKREAEKGHIIPPFMEGGPGNPLGARALYIGGTLFRVHGTNNEASIGGAVSSGCIRMMNADVIDLYDRVKVGTKIYVVQ